MQVMLNDVVLSFPTLFVPKPFSETNAQLAYSAIFIVPKDHKDLARVYQVIEEVGKATFKDDWKEEKESMVRQDRMALRDGNTKKKHMGFEGNLFVACRNSESSQGITKPKLIGRDKRELSAADGLLYAGAHVNALVDFWAQRARAGIKSRINASVLVVQFFAHGEAFAGGAAPSLDGFAVLDPLPAEDALASAFDML